MRGRELDIAIAENVFGAIVKHLNQRQGWRIDYAADLESCNDPIVTDYGFEGYRLKNFSTDEKSAMQVLKEVVERLDGFTEKLFIEFDFVSGKWTIHYFDVNIKGESPNLAHAICLFALKEALLKNWYR